MSSKPRIDASSPRRSISRVRTIRDSSASDTEEFYYRREPRRIREVSPEAEIAFLKSELADLDELHDDRRLPRLLNVALDLGTAYFEDGQMDEAESILQRVRHQMLQVWGWHRLTPHFCVKILVKVLVVNAKPDEAFELHTEAFVAVRQIFGREHPWTLQYQNNEGQFHVEKKDWVKAEDCFQKAADGKFHVFGTNHYSFINSLYNLDLVSYLRDGDAERFEEGLSFRLRKLRNIYGDRNRHTQNFARQLISIYFKTGHTEASQQLCSDMDLDIESADPSDGIIDVVHLDEIIPEGINPRISTEGGASATGGLFDIFIRIPQFSHMILSSVTWTRDKIMKWAELDISAFAKIMGLPETIDWSEFDDAAAMLKLAAELGHEPTVRSFLEKRRYESNSIQITDIMQDTLHRASMYRNDAVVRLLLEHGVAVDVKNFAGQTSLHQVAQRGHEEVAKTLLEFGANPIMPDESGLTPLDDALSEVYHPIVRLFMESRGALILSSKANNKVNPLSSRGRLLPKLKIVGLQSTTVDFYLDKTNNGEEVEEHRVRHVPVETLITGEDLSFMARDESVRVVRPTRLRSRSRERPPVRRRHISRSNQENGSQSRPHSQEPRVMGPVTTRATRIFGRLRAKKNQEIPIRRVRSRASSISRSRSGRFQNRSRSIVRRSPGRPRSRRRRISRSRSRIYSPDPPLSGDEIDRRADFVANGTELSIDNSRGRKMSRSNSKPIRIRSNSSMGRFNGPTLGNRRRVSPERAYNSDFRPYPREKIHRNDGLDTIVQFGVGALSMAGMIPRDIPHKSLKWERNGSSERRILRRRTTARHVRSGDRVFVRAGPANFRAAAALGELAGQRLLRRPLSNSPPRRGRNRSPGRRVKLTGRATSSPPFGGSTRSKRYGAGPSKVAATAIVGEVTKHIQKYRARRKRRTSENFSRRYSRVRYTRGLFPADIPTAHEEYSTSDFTWIHLPANNMEWVQAVMEKIQAESRDGIRCPDLLKDELWRRQQYESVSSAVHSRFMKPSCRVISGENGEDDSMVLFMPYIHWETKPERDKLQATVDKYKEKPLRKPFQGGLKGMVKKYFADDPGNSEENKRRAKIESHEQKDRMLIKCYINYDPPLHIRRTLDQFHYHMTDDTTSRDADQVISRYFTRKMPKKPVPVMMVDQLWLWIVNKETIVTSFPQRWGQHVKKSDTGGTIDMKNVLDSVLDHLKLRDRNPLSSVHELAELIVGRCLGLNHDATEWVHERYPYLEIFEYSINSVADEETACFNNFADHDREYDTYGAAREKQARKRKRPTTLGDEFEDVFDISREINLMKEIKDIRDELNIMRHLFRQQKEVLEKFCSAIDASSQQGEDLLPKKKPKIIDAINRQARYVDYLDQDAKRPYKALEDLLDLKQKQANVSEARSARISGNSITVFTIVTVIFLPASFMATFFAIPIAQYTRKGEFLDLGYVLKYLIATTTALAIPFIILALYVNPIMRGCKALFRSLVDINRVTIKIVKVAIAAAKSIILVSSKILWWQLKNLDRPMLLLKLVGFGFLALWAMLLNWKSILTSPLHYRKAKKLSKEQGTEWSKRRYAIGRVVGKRKRAAENEEWQYAERYESQNENGVGRADVSGIQGRSAERRAQ